MPYHSIKHVQGTLAAGALLVERCLKRGIPIDGEVVYYALLFHDAGYHEKHISKALPARKSILPTSLFSACVPKLFLNLSSNLAE
jgi:hypothetical protein